MIAVQPDLLGSVPLKGLSQSLRTLIARVSASIGKGGTMGRVESYRRYAAQCLALSRKATNSDDRELLVTMAQRWLELADRTHDIRRQMNRSGQDQRRDH